MVKSVGRGFWPSAWLLAVALGAGGIARAAETAAITQGASAAGAPARTGVGSLQFPVVVHLYTDSARIDAASVHSAIAAELGVPALGPSDPRAPHAEGAVTVSYRSTARELAVSYEHRGRAALTRVVTAPESLGEVAAVAALLAGNLARDQAAPLLAPPEQALAPAPRAPTLTAAASSAPRDLAAPPVQAANAAFFYPLATNFGRSNLKTHLDLNVLYGRIGTLDGFQLGTVSVVEDAVRGMQVAVAANLVRGTVEGLQAATALNAAAVAMTGAQLTLGLNYAGSLEGFQVSPLANLATAKVQGAQLAFGLNRAEDLDGLQVGLINVAGRVRGVQLGLVNVADDVDGVPVGLVSVTRSGGVHPVSWASNTSYGNFGVKFATRYTYTMISVSTGVSV